MFILEVSWHIHETIFNYSVTEKKTSQIYNILLEDRGTEFYLE